MNIYKTIWLSSCILFLAACNEKKESPTDQSGNTARHEERNIVELTGKQLKAAEVEFGPVEMKNLTSSISVNGTLVVPNQNKALATSIVGGVLRTLKVQPGDYVTRGQIIGTIANTELATMQQQVVSINAQLKYAEQDQRRQQELVQGNAAPMKNLQKADAEVNSLKAQRSALLSQLSVLGISGSGNISSSLDITAPISGTIADVTAQIGSNINANTPIAQIINNSELHLDLFIYEKDLPKVKSGQTIHFTLTNNPGKEYDATVYSIGTAFTNESKSIPVHARVVNDKTALIEGMSVTARISLGQQLYTAVPDDAIVNNGGIDYIFVVQENNDEKHEHLNKDEQKHEEEISFERIQIVKGASDIGYTEIKPINELKTDARIVTKGAFFLMAKMTNDGGDHGH